MATKKGLEVQKSEDLIQEMNVDELVNAEDPVKEVVSDINEYRNNLSQHLLNRLSELAAHPVDMARFGPSFKAGWQELKKQGDQRDESSFAVFLNAMIADTETL